MDLANFDLSVIYTREDGSYVINQGTYHVPNKGQWAQLYQLVDAYAKEHPDIVEPEPEPTADKVYEPSAKEQARGIVNSTAFEYAKHVYPYTEDQYTTLVNGGMYSEFNEDTDYPDGWLVLYEGNLYRLTKVEAAEETSTLRAATLSSTLTLGKYSLSLVWSKPTEE